jgi:hypothetical protein
MRSGSQVETRPRFYEDVLKCNVYEIKDSHGNRLYYGLRKKIGIDEEE